MDARAEDLKCKRTWDVYEAKDERSFTSLIAMQPLGADVAFMPQLKAMYVPFHMANSGLISRGYRVTDQNEEGCWLRSAIPHCAKQ